jgi:hypothetical protein
MKGFRVIVPYLITAPVFVDEAARKHSRKLSRLQPHMRREGNLQQGDAEPVLHTEVRKLLLGCV